MPLSDEVLEEINVAVRGGFDTPERILEIFLEEMYEPGELNAGEVEAAIDQALREHEASKDDWPEVTDCDRLDRAFAALSERNVIALQNAGNTQSDGYDDFRSALAERADSQAVVGYCFFHGQDLEGAVRGNGLHLAFGPTSPENEDEEGPAVGRIIVEELQRAGLAVVWDGTFKKRIFMPKFEWQRR